MNSKQFLKAFLLALFVVLAFFISWELLLRSKGFDIAYDDGPPLFAEKRAQVYLPKDEATVFIGSSRIKFDLDIATWKGLTGEEAIQLANVGSSPLPVLDDLAADPNFKGKLVIDVTEGLFFSENPVNFSRPQKGLAYYKKITPAEKASFKLNNIAESKLVFLDMESFSLPAFLDKVPLHNRPGVISPPIFPPEFSRVNADRQEIMMDRFVSDTNIQNKVKDVWKFLRSINKREPPSGPKLDSFLTAIKNNCDKIRQRGGQVVFVRTPSSGPSSIGEEKAFPRKKYWNRILEVTGCPGVHYADYPSIANFICPEWSHLSPKDAIVFTKEFVGILHKDYGWKFSSLQ